MARPGSYRSVNGGRPVSPSSVAAPTNCRVPALATVCTAMPRLARREISSQALKQAIEPVSRNRSFASRTFDIVDQPHRSETHGREAACFMIRNIFDIEPGACECAACLVRGVAARDALGQQAMKEIGRASCRERV